MKIGAIKTASFLGLGLGLSVALVQAGCGKPNDTSSNPMAALGAEGGTTPMKGIAGFGTQCQSGYNSNPKPARLQLWSCPINLPLVELTEPLAPLMLSADCVRKTLTVRTIDRTVDTTWEVMPDGTFYITVDGLNAKLKSDGEGGVNCSTPLSTDMWGKIECNGNRDQAKIRLETVMWLGKAASPTPSATSTPNNPVAPPPRPAANQCKLPPTKCYFHATSSVNQCY